MLGQSPVRVGLLLSALPCVGAGICTERERVFHAASPHARPPELRLRCDTICHFTLAKPHQQIVQRAALMQAALKKKKKKRLI